MGQEISQVDSSEIQKMLERFGKLDEDKSGALSAKEFLQIPELNSNPLVERVIDVFDTDGDGEVFSSFSKFFIGKTKNFFPFRIRSIFRNSFAVRWESDARKRKKETSRFQEWVNSLRKTIPNRNFASLSTSTTSVRRKRWFSEFYWEKKKTFRSRRFHQ